MTGDGFLWRYILLMRLSSSRTTELLAVLLALQVFGFLDEKGPKDSTPLKVLAGTDNMANEHLLKKGLTTKWPLCLVFMQMTQLLMKSGLVVQLNWRPRDENALADALTNLDFKGVDPKLRMECKWEDLELGLLWKLWSERENYLDKDHIKANSKRLNLGEFEKSSW